jgi:hypothetical protein
MRKKEIYNGVGVIGALIFLKEVRTASLEFLTCRCRFSTEITRLSIELIFIYNKKIISGNKLRNESNKKNCTDLLFFQYEYHIRFFFYVIIYLHQSTRYQSRR